MISKITMNNQNQIPKSWYGKRYYSLDAYCKTVYQEKLYKIAIDAGLTCPNRDGKLDTRGCIFCSAGGSGDFAVSGRTHSSVNEQLEAGKALFHGKPVGTGWIAYFQAYTNTYGSPDYLYRIFHDALSHPEVRGISIATRPDCLGEEILSLLHTLLLQFPEKFIWVELGLQTMHEQTAAFIRRGYPLSVYEEAVTNLVNISVPVITHLILGLPGEQKEDFLATVSYMNRLYERQKSLAHPNRALPMFGVKLQLLHILRHTDLDLLYQKNQVSVLSKEDYIDWLISGIETLSSEIVIHRITGDGPKNILRAPLWSLDKRNVLNSIAHQLKVQDTWQGKEYHGSTHNSTL